MRILALLAIGFFLAGCGRLASQVKPLPIKIVAKWEDLLKQPNIDIGNGINIRLGVDSIECPQFSGVALYAYTEGFDDEEPRSINRDALGPVWISVKFEGENYDCKGRYTFLPRWEWQIGDKQPRLLCRFLMADKVGNYHVNVRTEKGKNIAQVAFKSTTSPFHPWSPLLLTKETEYERLGDQYKYRRKAPAKAIYTGIGIALPNMPSFSGYSANGWSPWWKKFKMGDENKQEYQLPLTFGKGPLPKVLPQNLDSHLQLKFNQDKMLVRIISADLIYRYRPDWHFLCRWWVNGKPFIPEQEISIPQMEGGALLIPDEEEDMQIELKITPKDLKAKSGDLIELQMLYCPCGWLPVVNPQTSEKAGLTDYPRLTNKIFFRMP